MRSKFLSMIPSLVRIDPVSILGIWLIYEGFRSTEGGSGDRLPVIDEEPRRLRKGLQNSVQSLVDLDLNGPRL